MIRAVENSSNPHSKGENLVRSLSDSFEIKNVKVNKTKGMMISIKIIRVPKNQDKTF